MNIHVKKHEQWTLTQNKLKPYGEQFTAINMKVTDIRLHDFSMGNMGVGTLDSEL